MAEKRICIVAMDGSEHADYALEWFIEHVHRSEDHVILVYVPELNEILRSSNWTTAAAMFQFDHAVMEQMLKEEQTRIRADLDKFADKLRHHGLGGKVKSVMSTKPGEGIITAAEQEGAHLIVTGSRGQGKLRRTFMGSVSDYVVHHSHIPVFVCKLPHKHVPDHEHQSSEGSKSEEVVGDSKPKETSEVMKDSKPKETTGDAAS